MRFIYGPVPSRRLGVSLGVDLVPHKTCSFNCIYCQLGRTTNQTLNRKEYVKAKEVLKELDQFLKSPNPELNYITLSGSGEPTLNSKIGDIISGIKELTPIPVAVLTNGSLLWQEEVRKDLSQADLLVPSLDAATQSTFERINRPSAGLKIGEIIEGLVSFSREFKGKIWLEIMLVKGINDGPDEIEKMRRTITRIKPDKVHLNTVIRPPAEEFALPLERDELEAIVRELGPPAETIAVSIKRGSQLPRERDIEEEITTLLARRPCTLEDLVSVLGIHHNELLKHLDVLQGGHLIETVFHDGQRYWHAAVARGEEWLC